MLIKTWFDEPTLFTEMFDREQSSSKSFKHDYFQLLILWKNIVFDGLSHMHQTFIKLASLMKFDGQFDAFAPILASTNKICEKFRKN